MSMSDPLADMLTRIRNAAMVNKYGPDGESAINGLKRVSKPGLRKYAKANAVPKVLDGLGIAIISTSKGIVTDKTARAQNTGGEILCEVW